jgi:hypothetical protein
MPPPTIAIVMSVAPERSGGVSCHSAGDALITCAQRCASFSISAAELVAGCCAPGSCPGLERGLHVGQRQDAFSSRLSGRPWPTGVPAGASTPYHMSTSLRAQVQRAQRRHLGQQRVRPSLLMPSATQPLPDLHVLQGHVDGQEHHVDLAAQQVGQRRAGAAVGDVRDEDAGSGSSAVPSPGGAACRCRVRRSSARRACCGPRASSPAADWMPVPLPATSSSWPQLVSDTGSRSFSGSKPSFGYSPRFITIVLTVTSSVLPSAGERTTASVPRLPDAPGAVVHHHRAAQALGQLGADLARDQVDAGAGREGHDQAQCWHIGRLRPRARPWCQCDHSWPR